MDTIAFVARIKPGKRDHYIKAHRNFSPELKERYLSAGIHQIRLFLQDDQIFMYVEANDYEAARKALAEDPLDQDWQERVSPMKDPDFHRMTEIFRLA